MLKSHLIKNPLTVWLRYFLRALFLEFYYRSKHLKLGYMTNVSKCSFGDYNTIYDYVTLREVELGDFTYIARGGCFHKTKIGKFCSIGPDIKCGLGRHPSHTFVSTHPIFFSTLKQSQITFADKNYFEEYKHIEIGNDVWIGANVVIVDGVKIADGAIIAASSVVTKDVPSYAIMAGSPAKIIKFRFDENTINHLIKIRWWDLDIKFIKGNFKMFHDVNIFSDRFHQHLP